ncbi:hypothetical protein ACOMHN_040453 [Nucella lapillus]
MGWTENAGCGSLETQHVLHNLRNLSVGMSDDRLRKVVLAPLIAQPRVSGTPGNDRARSLITKWMSDAGWAVEEDSFLDITPYGQRRFTNIIATLNPNGGRRVVVACHYDSKLMFGPFPFVAATDSAVPCALMIDSALKLPHFFLDKTGNTSSVTLQFVFFDGEEAFVKWSPKDSVYGARHLADKWASTPDPTWPAMSYLQTIEALILLDLIGTADTRFANRFPQTTAWYTKLRNIEMCLRENGYLKATGNPVPLFTSLYDYSLIQDDHLPFLKRGVPIVHLISSPFPWVWHTPFDNENALDFPRIDNLARILRIFLADLAL